jgi:hypothetical protein
MAEFGTLNYPSKEIITSDDNIVIKKYIDGYEGGRTLDTTDYPLSVIKAGHVIIVETATKKFKPMPLNTAKDAYATFPTGHKYAGIVVATKTADRPFVGILTQGTVNPAAAPFKYDSILTDLKAALPHIEFRED